MRTLGAAVIVAITTSSLLAQDASQARTAMLARAKALELDTKYVPPPGDPLAHHAAGFAKVMCSAVFISSLSPEFAAEHVGYFTALCRGASVR